MKTEKHCEATPAKTDFARKNAALNRRKLLTTGAMASVGLLGVPGFAERATDAVDFETRLAARVRTLAQGDDIVLQVLMPTGSGASLRPVAAAFTEMTGVRVSLNEVPPTGIIGELLLDAMTGGARYDVALPATFGLPDLAEAGAIRPIDEFATRYEPPGFRDGLIYDLGDRVGDDLYGYQTDGDAYMMFYHRDMHENPANRQRYADQYGTELGIPRTWQELDRQMAFFHQPDDGQFGGILFRAQGYIAWEWWVRFHAKGVWPFDREMIPTIAGDAGVEAVEEMIRSQAHLSPRSLTVGLVDNWRVYSEGKTYCNIGWGGTQKYLNRPDNTMKGKVLHGPTPGGYVHGELLNVPYFNWGWNYVVTTSSQIPEQAYLFALFASGPRMSTLAVAQQESFFDPYRPEHYEDPAIRRAYSPEFLAVQRASLEGAIPDLYLPGQADYFRALNDGLIRALSGEDTPQKAMERVAQIWELTTARAGRRTQTAMWSDLRDQYPAQAQRLLRFK